MSTEQAKIAPGDVVTLKSDDTHQLKMTVGKIVEPEEGRHGGVNEERASVWYLLGGELKYSLLPTAALSKIA